MILDSTAQSLSQEKYQIRCLLCTSRKAQLSSEEHTHHVHQVLQRLLENKLFVNAEKCKFHARSVSLLEYIIEGGQLRADPEKIRAVAEWPNPTTLKQLQRFLGFANFYRRFIRDYSRVAAPLTRFTSPATPLNWTPEANSAFSELKMLSLPLPSWPNLTLLVNSLW
ncbi:uncharacterized protein [Hemitrygon akajei]|uniref:uncharacterized protein n=1 Tax=Hemitrygon akajei TaxID=2704970 RepID=UPI003BF9977B